MKLMISGVIFSPAATRSPSFSRFSSSTTSSMPAGADDVERLFHGAEDGLLPGFFHKKTEDLSVFGRSWTAQAAEKVFFHPDCRLSAKESHLVCLLARGLYRRSGISPRPEDGKHAITCGGCWPFRF
jgi:hypothetical protein